MGRNCWRAVRDDLDMKALKTFSMRGMLFKKGEEVRDLPVKNVPLLIAEGWIAEDEVSEPEIVKAAVKPAATKKKEKK
jgi:hypothetical protein